jgi:hypothetical protein
MSAPLGQAYLQLLWTAGHTNPTSRLVLCGTLVIQNSFIYIYWASSNICHTSKCNFEDCVSGIHLNYAKSAMSKCACISPLASGHRMTRLSAYSQRSHELGISQLVIRNRGFQIEIYFIRMLHVSRQVTSPLAFAQTSCNWRGTDVALLFVCRREYSYRTYDIWRKEIDSVLK